MVCQLTPAQEARMYEILRGIADDPHALEMQQFIQHGTVTTYEHCLRVTRIAYWLNLHWHCHADEVSLVRGAFLHDFYLYDWHNCSNITHWHGFKHPLIARYNADAVFQLNNKERNIIQTHMWPLTITQLPRCREACLVCLADKMSSSWETLMERRAKREASHAARSFGGSASSCRIYSGCRASSAPLSVTRAGMNAYSPPFSPGSYRRSINSRLIYPCPGPPGLHV